MLTDAAVAVTGLKASDFSNMQASFSDADRKLTGAKADDVIISYTVTTSTREVGTKTPESAFTTVKSKLEAAVSNRKFAKAIVAAAHAHGVTGLESVTTSSIVVSSYGALYPSAAPTTGALGAAAASQGAAASDSSNDNLTIGLSVGLVLGLVVLAAFVFYNSRRAGAKKGDESAASAQVELPSAGTAKAYASHDFDAETEASTVSPMAHTGRFLGGVRDSIPRPMDPRVSVVPKRL